MVYRPLAHRPLAHRPLAHRPRAHRPRALALAFALALAAPACAPADGAPEVGTEQADAEATAAPGSTATRFPIVLAHGLGGTDELFGVFEYFNGIPDALRGGGAKVFVTEVNALDGSQGRGEQLLRQVERIAGDNGGKVNLIGHSQGGLDARFVLARRPDLLASVTTVGTPHKGSEIADFLAENVEGGAFNAEAGEAVGAGLELLLRALTGRADQDAAAALGAITSAGAADFNRRFPAGVPSSRCGQGASTVNGVRLFSWSGTAVKTDGRDPTDLALDLASKAFDEANDGITGRCSSHFGKVIKDDFALNHFDQINQAFGLVGDDNPVQIFIDHARRLRQAGL
jgi:triacylglycerol lipase